MQTYTDTNKGSFDPATVPPLPGPESRFEGLPTNPSGYAMPGTQVAADSWTILFDRLKDKAEPIQPEFVSVNLMFCGRDVTSGEYVLLPRGTIRAVPTLKNKREGRFGRGGKETAGAILDALFESGAPGVRDDAVWSALQEWAQRTQPDGTTMRRVSDLTALACLYRAGILGVRPDELPGIGREHAHAEA